MTPEIGAPGDGITRREFVAATGTTGAVAAAGCMTTTDPTVQERGNTASTLSQSMPTTSPPENKSAPTTQLSTAPHATVGS